MRILLRPRTPVWVLLLLAPAIPELLTGSTPITRLAIDPVGFVVGWGFDVALYGCGALVIREFAALLRRGWASILLWGAAYGIGEEGFAVHTFFERSGSPVGVLTTYGAAAGVDWLWALGLTIFHATYSIALPILLVRLAFPAVAEARWLDPGALALTGAVYLADVVVLALLVGHGPSVAAFALFLALAVALVTLGALAPRSLLRVSSGPSRLGRLGIGVAGALEWIGWVAVLVIAGARALPAGAAALLLVALDALALAIVLRRVGAVELERSQIAFAAGMLVPLFLWDILIEASVPGILLVAAAAAYLLYRLARVVDARSRPIAPPRGVGGAP